MKKFLLDPEIIKLITYLLPVFVVLLGVIVGFALNRAYEWMKEKMRIHKLIMALYIELMDISSWLARLKHVYEKGLKLLTHRVPPDDMPIQIPTHIYDHYFEELSIHLSGFERISFNNIYSLIEMMHSQRQKLNLLMIEYIKDKTRLEEICCIFEGAYINLLTALAQANFHLCNQKRFKMKKLLDKQSTIKYLNLTSITEKDAIRLDKDIKEKLLDLRSQAMASTVESIRQEKA